MPNIVLRVHYYSPIKENVSVNYNQNNEIKKRKYYSSNSGDGNDYMQYIDSGIKQKSDFDYLDYMGVHENSSGVFDKNGILTFEKKKEVRSKLRKTKSVIWDMVVSFEEMFGLEKVNSYQDAQDLLKHSLPKFFKDNGLAEDNIIWFAGLHRNTDNRHIHLCFFEKEPTHRRARKSGLYYHFGKINKISIENFKVYTEEFMNDSEFFIESYRRKLLDGTLDVLALLQGKNNSERRIKEKLSMLFQLMPKGKLSYMHQEMVSVRPLINEIEDLIISGNPVLQHEYLKMLQELKKKDQSIEKICQSQNIAAERYLMKDKYLDDFLRRIGNKIIEYAKKYEYAEKYEGKSYEYQTKIRRINKRNCSALLRHTAVLTQTVEYEAKNAFEEFMEKLAKAEEGKLIGEGVEINE